MRFSPSEQVVLREGISPHCCSLTLTQVKSFHMKIIINVAICLGQGAADLQMHIHEWLQ